MLTFSVCCHLHMCVQGHHPECHLHLTYWHHAPPAGWKATHQKNPTRTFSFFRLMFEKTVCQHRGGRHSGQSVNLWKCEWMHRTVNVVQLVSAHAELWQNSLYSRCTAPLSACLCVCAWNQFCRAPAGRRRRRRRTGERLQTINRKDWG